MTLRRAPARTTYRIGHVPLQAVEEIRDLGVILDTKLTFAPHISKIVSQANRALGLLIRSFQTASRGAKFEKKYLLVAYFANVRSVLEYGCVVWAGTAKSHGERVDRVQHKFLLWLNNHTAQPCDSLSYRSLLNHFGIPSLAARRLQYDLLFLKSIFSGKINSVELLDRFSIHVPARLTRSLRLFTERRGRVSTVCGGLLCRIPRRMNEFLAVSRADFFYDDFNTFRTQVIRYIKAL